MEVGSGRGREDAAGDRSGRQDHGGGPGAVFDHLEDQIARTDSKAQVVLAADAILLSWFSTQNLTGVQALLGEHASAAARVTALLTAFVVVGLFLSLATGLVVICRGPGHQRVQRWSILGASHAAASQTSCSPLVSSTDVVLERPV